MACAGRPLFSQRQDLPNFIEEPEAQAFEALLGVSALGDNRFLVGGLDFMMV